MMLLDEAHSSLDVCANCGCGQFWRCSLLSAVIVGLSRGALEAVVRADLVMLFTCLAVIDWQVDHPPAHCMNMLK